MKDAQSLVVDVDSHWTVPWEFEMSKGPLKHFARKLPDPGGMAAFFLADDLLGRLPRGERPSPQQLFPPRTRADGTVVDWPELFEVNRAISRVDERLAWMDQIGIDYAIVNPAGFPAVFPLLEDVKDRQDYCRASNEFLEDELNGRSDRLGGVAVVDLTDLDWAIAELRRVRAAGSRTFGIRAEPVNGLSLGHPHFDRLWSCVVDLGMIVSLHIGLAPAAFGDWGRLGIDFNSPGGRGAFLRMANSQRYQAAELFLSALLFGGVFARHPKLTVLLAELYVFWLPLFVRRMAALTHPYTAAALGPWSYPLSGDEYLRRNVRASPLPGLGDVDALHVLQQLPEMIVFSSDYPHSEGNADPVALYGGELATLDPGLRTAFMGRTIANSFALTGDPLKFSR